MSDFIFFILLNTNGRLKVRETWQLKNPSGFMFLLGRFIV